MPRSVDRFNSAIKQFQQVRTQGEKAGRVSQSEMQKALAELTDDTGNVSRSSLKAAKDLFNGSVDMTRGSREMLKGFIEQNAGGPAPSTGGGVRTMDAAEMQNYLRDPGVLDGVFQAAFGSLAMSRSSSKEVGNIRELPNGNFEVDVELVHWRTRGTMASGTVELNGSGSVVDSDVQLPQDPRDAKITADGPIGPLGGGGGHVFKVRADDPLPNVPNDPRPDPRDVKITADGPIGGGSGGRIFKVRADDPIGGASDAVDDDNAPPPSPPRPAPTRSGGRVFKITADEPI